MDIQELQSTHAEHARRVADWRKWRAVYDGTDAIIAGGYFKQHERESDDNYERRCEEALSWGISQAIVDLFAQYLFLHPIEREFGRLADDELFERFLADCDYLGNGMDVRLREDSKWAGVYGHVGYLVDRPAEVSSSRAEDVAQDRRPYIVRYFPTAILDWAFRRESGHLNLTYVKLLDSDGSYRLWWRNKWEVWRISENGEPVLEDSGTNEIGEGAFIWLYSTPSPDEPGIGLSDMRELARFDLSIMANVSQGDEVITYAAFPMMRAPKKRAGEDQDDEAGPTAILEFDPEYPESKPDWLEAQVKEPIDAITSWIEGKELRAHKHAHASFIAGVGQAEAKAGIALQIEFTELGVAFGPARPRSRDSAADR
jgi:hypothetical protein